jgi:gliding motility-associated-like protein
MVSYGAKEIKRGIKIYNKNRLKKITGYQVTAFFILFFCLYLPKPIFAQLEADYWMFSPGKYVYFNHGAYPDTIHYPNNSSQLFFGSGCTSYSDKSGNLLFYGVGGTLFDRNFQLFPSLAPGPTDNLLNYVYDYATQPVLTIPYPGHDSLYIRFHIWSNVFNGNKTQLCYSVINMKLRNGLGEVDPAQKNISLFNGAEVGYKLTAVLHCNKKDVWVIGHLLNSDQYFSLLVTQAGISNAPVYFSGNYISSGTSPGYSTNPNHFGCMKMSASGTRLAAAYKGLGLVELMDFNSQTGTGSNLKTLNVVPPDTAFYSWQQVWYGPYGLDFSPSGDKLYVTGSYGFRNYINQSWGVYLDQFDVSLPTLLQIQDSRFTIDSIEGRLGGAIQIANNGKMYVNVQNQLCEISDPENSGMACNYTRFKVWSGSQYGDLNLPTYIQSYFRFPVIATGNCQFQNISFSVQNLNGVSSIIWDFGDPASGVNNSSTSLNPTHIFSLEDSYEVKAVLYRSDGCGADTIRKVIHAGPFKVFLGNDTTICSGDTLKLRMEIPGGNNLWSNNSRDTIMNVSASGIYWVRVNIGDCYTMDSINVSVQSLPVFNLGDDTTICSNQSLLLTINNSPSNVSCLWSSGSTSSSTVINAPGQYWLRIQDNQFGCRYSDTITVQFKAMPNYSLGRDTALCVGSILPLNASLAGASAYLWNTGETTPTASVTQTGTYWADVTKDQCTYRDSISVLFKPLPTVNLGSDTTLCEDNLFTLDAANSGALYLWQNGSLSSSLVVTQPGQYFVKVTKDGCSTADTISVEYDLKPVFTLGSDFGICNGQSVLLQPTIQSSSAVLYLWQNGSSNSSLVVTQPGQYTLAVSNYCGTRSDDIKVAQGVCRLYIPSAFSPNGDGINDVFKAEYGENVTSFQLEIYNRWGQKIFQSKNISDGWDGTFNGTLQPTGLYIWIIRHKETNNIKENLLKGTVTLIR